MNSQPSYYMSHLEDKTIEVRERIDDWFNHQSGDELEDIIKDAVDSAYNEAGVTDEYSIPRAMFRQQILKNIIESALKRIGD